MKCDSWMIHASVGKVGTFPLEGKYLRESGPYGGPIENKWPPAKISIKKGKRYIYNCGVTIRILYYKIIIK